MNRRFIIFSALACIVSFTNCVRDPIGTFYISDDARKFEVDTSVTSFSMVDNLGISEDFQLTNSNFRYYTEWGDGPAYDETFGVYYTSVVNNYQFSLTLRGTDSNTTMEIEWNQNERMHFNFGSGKVGYGIKASISFIDSLQIRNKFYIDVMEVDYSGKENLLQPGTPVKYYITGKYGLIKFIRKDGIFLERSEGKY